MKHHFNFRFYASINLATSLKYPFSSLANANCFSELLVAPFFFLLFRLEIYALEF